MPAPIKNFFSSVNCSEDNKLSKIFLTSFLLLIICFNYSMLRCLKDTVVITASSGSILPFLKVWAILPLAVFFTFLYAKLSSKFSFETVCYTFICIFLSFFIVFAFFLYPNREFFRLTNVAQFLTDTLPKGSYGFIAMIEHWSLALFYSLAELWSNLILGVLTWGFINQITSLKEARFSYSLLSAASNIAAVLAGMAANLVLSFSSSTWETNFKIMIMIIVANGVIAMALFSLLYRRVNVKGPISVKKKNKVRFSLIDSIKEVLRSKHLTCLSIIVLGYFFAIHTVEVLWKDELLEAYPDPNDFSHYMNTLTALIGILSTILALALPYLIRRFGWTKTAIITPVTMLVTSILFFSTLIFQTPLTPIFALLSTTPMMAAVFFGAIQNWLSKSAKYSIFDATKEMAFIPLSYEEQLKGKAAIDGVGSRLGKSGASLLHQILLLSFGGLSSCTPFLAVFMLIIVTCWIFATKAMGIRIDEELCFKGGIVTNKQDKGEETTGLKHPIDAAQIPAK